MADETDDVTGDDAAQQAPADYSGMDSGQLQYEDTLIDRGVDDVLDEGYSPPDHLVNAETFFETPEEAVEGESLDDRLAAELPDPANDLPDPLAETAGDRTENAAGTDDTVPDVVDEDAEFAGEDRSGRLVAPDEGEGPDVDSELIGEDVGVDGSASSAEEAAVHVIPEE